MLRSGLADAADLRASGRMYQHAQCRLVRLPTLQESPALIGGKIAASDDHQAEPVSGNFDLSTLVVESSLDASMNAADREYVRLVKVEHGLVVLALSILDYEPMARIVGVHWQASSSTIPSGITDEPVETVLAPRRFAEDRIAEVDHVSLVRVCASPAHVARRPASHTGLRSCRQKWLVPPPPRSSPLADRSIPSGSRRKCWVGMWKDATGGQAKISTDASGRE